MTVPRGAATGVTDTRPAAAMPAVPLLRAFEGEVAPPDVLAAIRDGDAAGVALYRGLNVRSPEQLRALTGDLQAAARAGGQPPAIVAIDQEGGQLMGVGAPATPFAGNLALGAVDDPMLAEQVGRAMGRELAALGINVDWAPDLDLATAPASPAVGARAFGDDPVAAGRLGSAFIRGIQGERVAAAAKHFPGSGETLADPHHGLPVVDVDAATLETRELAPFRDAIAAGVRMVMVTHGAYPSLEPDGAPRPALRSSAILRTLLRERMGFAGVVVSDALDMAAVDQSDVATAALDAIAAGVDLLLAGPTQADRPAELARLVTGLRGSPEALVAADRVDALRRWLGEGAQPDLDVVGCMEHQALAEGLARRSVVLVRDEMGLLPLDPAVRGGITVVTPAPADLTPADTSSWVHVRLADAVARRAPGTQALEVPIDPGPADIARVLAATDDAGLTILGTIDAAGHGGQRALAAALAERGPVVLVAMRMPGDVVVVPGPGTALACHSIHDPSTEAVGAILFGEVATQGRLPLRVAGAPGHPPGDTP